MPERRQSTISLTPREKSKLEDIRQAYEEKTGDESDWGRFLLTLGGLALVTLGVYKLARASKNQPTTECPWCGEHFAIACTEELPRMAYVTCPKPECGKEMVVDFGNH